MSQEALLKRVNRFLKPNNEQVRRLRNERARAELGDLVVWDWVRNIPGEVFVDIEDLARRLELLRPNERAAP